MTRFALIASLLATATPAFASPSYDVEYVSSSTREYAILKNTGLTLTQAYDACEKEGFYLADIDDTRELDFVVTAIADVYGNFSWVADLSRAVSLHATSSEGYSLENGTPYVRPRTWSYGAVCERPVALP